MRKEKQPHGGALMRAEKGDVNNPKGRPKGAKSFKSIYKRFLKKEIDVEEAGEILKITKKEFIALLNIRTATDADEDPNVRMKAAELIAKHTDTVKSKVDINHKGNIGITNGGEMTDEQFAALKAAAAIG